MSKAFHYDYFSLADLDLEQWNRDFFWPVSREATTQITIDLKEEHCRIINSLGNTFEGDCLAIGHLISNKFAEIANHYLSVRRLLDSGFDIRYSRHLDLIPQLLKTDEPLTLPFGSFKNIEYKAGRRIWYFQNSLRYNFAKGIYSLQDHFNLKNSSLVFGSAIGRNYFKTLNTWVRHDFNGFMLDFSKSDRNYSSDMLNSTAEHYASFVSGYTEDKFGVRLPPAIQESMRDYACKYLQDIAVAYSAIRNAMRKHPVSHAYTTTAGSPYIRAFSLAVRGEGGIVSGFPHGYFISHHSGPRLALHELATVDEFIAYFPGSTELYQRNYQMNPPPRNNKVTFRHDNTPDLKNVSLKRKDKPLPDRIKTVMILEISLISEWAGYYVAEALVNYHFYYNLCQALSRNGYNVIFKRRPKDVGWEGINMFKDIPNVRIVYEHFEAPGVIDQADAIVIQYACSSTLQWAMCTEKTVIYVDSGWEPWFPDVYKSMEKRCRILHCRYDDRNRAVFEEKELLEILERKPEQPDTEFIERYLFPEQGALT